MSQLMALLPGFVAGCIFVLLIWGLTVLVSSKARQRKSARKDEIISSIENKWADVDSIIQSYRQGRLLENVFRNELTQKLEAINRLFKPAMHQLDLFYVKYTEKIIAENNRFLNEDLPLVRPTAAFKALPAIDNELYREPGKISEVTPQESEVETGITQAPEPAFETTETRAPAMEDALLEQPAEQPEQEPPETAPDQEEPVITAMAESSSEASDILPIETFLEMETGMGMAAEPVTPAEESGIEDAFPESSQDQEAPTPYVAEETTSSSPPPAVDRTTPEEDEQLFEGGEPDALPPPPVFAQRQEAQDYPEETMSEEPVYEYAPMSTPDDEPVPPPPPFERQPGHKRDETVEPATIYDIEAETIIADRSEIMGTKKPAKEKEESQRSGLGITGDDISDQLDNFFNIK